MVDSGWETGNHNPRPLPRVRKTDTFIVFYLFILYFVTCLKTCHFAACFYDTMNIYLFLFSMLKLHVTLSQVCLNFLNIYHFTSTFSHAHTKVHTHRHTCTIKKCQKKPFFHESKENIRAHSSYEVIKATSINSTA